MVQGRHSAIDSWAAVMCLVAVAVLGGCSSGSLLGPEEVPAGWEFLTYYTSSSGGTLLVEGDGSISFAGTGAVGAPDLGLLSAASWQALRRAAERAELDPIEVALAKVSAGVSLIRLSESGRLWGFSWIDEFQLSQAQRELIELLEGICQDADSQEDELTAHVPVETILHGMNACYVEPREALVRDEDALLALIDEALPGEGVILESIDFASEMVVAVFMGLQRQGSDLELTGNAYWTLAGDLCIPLGVMETQGPCDRNTGPYVVLSLPKVESDIFFVRDRRSAPCKGD